MVVRQRNNEEKVLANYCWHCVVHVQGEDGAEHLDQEELISHRGKDRGEYSCLPAFGPEILLSDTPVCIVRSEINA